MNKRKKTEMIRKDELNGPGVSYERAAVRLDFSRPGRPIKPLHGIGNSPLTLGKPLPEILEAGIPYTRLHDTGGAYGQNRFVDVPNIFRDFDADPSDPTAYDFAFTDAYLKGLVASGLKIVYRLGVTIENQFDVKPMRIDPPKDFLKWARICEGIINHYNNGWANGFHFNIEYWEIWNEPEQPSMWTGTMEQFFDFYRTVATYLKSKFHTLKFGGYPSSGFCAYSIGGDAAKNPKYQSFLTWFHEFFRFLARTKTPCDFCSWHSYPFDINLLKVEAEYASRVLDENGFQDLEVILDEWNYQDWHYEWKFDLMRSPEAACFVASALCAMQSLRIDKAMYYDANPSSLYCGLFDFTSGKPLPPYYSLRMFNELYRLGTQAFSRSPENDRCYALAATNGSTHAALMTNLNTRDRELALEVTGAVGAPRLFLLDRHHLYTPTQTILLEASRILLPAQSVVLAIWK